MGLEMDPDSKIQSLLGPQTASEIKMSVNKQSEMYGVGGFLEDFFVKKRRCREIGLAKMLR